MAQHPPGAPFRLDAEEGVTRQSRPTGPRTWDVVCAVAAGGALGALGRYALSVAMPHRPPGFPWSTFATNVSGCVLIGVLMVCLAEAGSPHRLLRPFLGIGLLGGFTTFSTYTVETQQLLAAGAPRLAVTYLGATLVTALAAVLVGVACARAVVRSLRRRRPTAG